MTTIDSFDVYLKHRPIKGTLGLIDHWYFDIPALDMEIHPGEYGKGTHLPSNSTKGAHTYQEVTMCKKCVDKLSRTSVFLNQIFYYPFINCETLVSHGYCTTMVSTQLLALIAIAVSALLIVVNLALAVFILFVIIVYFMFSKYTYSVTIKSKCNHVL